MFSDSRTKVNNNPVIQASRVESEMQPHLERYPMPVVSSKSLASLELVMAKAFCAQPILGDIILDFEQREKLHAIAVNTLTNALGRAHLQDYGLSDFYSDALVLETALLLRNWSDIDDENEIENNTNFWEYICNQYALPYDESFGNSHAYRIFRTAITKSLKRHNRLFVKSGQKYYTTMLIHALAPKAKFYALFEQIFAFYAETLEYQYIKSDPAFRAFSYAMKLRFESGGSRQDDAVYIKSVQSSSAIKALFLYCPEYMCSFVERVVCAIDSLVATGSLQESSYIDTLLLSWHKNRSREERSAAKRARSRAGTERAVTEFSNIRVIYRYEDSHVSLIIPSIRLGGKSDTDPWITVYRGPDDTSPYSHQLRYYGDYFCITSRRTAISLDALLSEGAERIEPRVIITHNNKNIYDSASRLYRDFIAFDDSGGEISKRPDREYVNVFVAEYGCLQGEATSPDCSANTCADGFLYRILIDDKTFISVNGANIFPVERIVGGLTLNMSIAPVSNCRYLSEQRECLVFTVPATLTITSENEHIEKQYRLIIDEITFPLADYRDISNNRVSVALPHGEGPHELRIIENTTQQRIYTLSYVVVEGFSLNFDGFYYFEGFTENGTLEVSDNNGSSSYPYKLLYEQASMIISYGDGELSVDIPTLYCRLGGKALPPDEGRIYWYNDIAMSALLEINAPRGYSNIVAVGQEMYSAEKIELGNVIRSRHDDSVEAVGVILRKGDEPPVQIKLFDVAFEPQFKSDPLLVEAGSLLWCVEDNYIGDTESELEVLLSYKGREIGCYNVGYIDEVIPLDFHLEDGVYDYTVSQKAPGFFTSLEDITCGRFIVGDPALFRFDDCAVIVTEAAIDNERIELKPTSGIITNLQYIGELGLNGETQHYPCYEGYLQFKHEGILRPYATKDYESKGIYREQVNPVKLWLINDYTISLRSPLDDGLYVNKRWKSITDRTPSGPGMSYTGSEISYCNPDYYSFKIINMSEVENV